jgi:linoleoyl-CoA desaturase
MQKLKFTRDEGTLFYRELKERVDTYFADRNLPKTGNLYFKIKMGLYFSLDILFYYLMITAVSPEAFFIFYLAMGISILLTAFNVSHDASHGVAVKSKFWNKVLFQISFNLQGNNAYVWGKNHTESHHLYTNVEGSDIDVLNNPVFRMTDSQKIKAFHKYQWLYAPFLYMLYSLNWFLFRETLMLVNISSRTIQVSIPKMEVVKLIFYKVVYIGYMLILPITLLDLPWTYILLAFILNHFLVSLIFVGVLGVSHVSDYVHHPTPDVEGRLSMSWPKLQMLTSIDYNAQSVFCNWTLGGFNAHALHHLLPDVCHGHYLKILPIFREVAAKHNMIYMEMGYGEALNSHFRQLKKMGRNEHYSIRNYAP